MIVEPQNVYGDKDLTTGREVHTTPRPEREPFFRADIEAQRPSPEEQQQTSRKFEHVNMLHWVGEGRKLLDGTEGSYRVYETAPFHEQNDLIVLRVEWKPDRSGRRGTYRLVRSEGLPVFYHRLINKGLASNRTTSWLAAESHVRAVVSGMLGRTRAGTDMIPISNRLKG
jgi:hypothetical protein